MFGMSSTLFSGPTIHSLPATAAAYSGVGERSSSRSSTSAQCTVIYAAAALGIVHDLTSNTQQFFNGHVDDISCISVSPCGAFAATGCVASVGRRLPRVMIWSCLNLSTQNNGLISVVGDGFFQRAVAAVAFSFDSQLICCISCDDNHRMGIWSFGNGRSEMITEINCHHGLPEDIRGLCWGPSQVYTEWISREHTSPCDVIATSGEKHLKVWSFRRNLPSASNLELGGSPQGASLCYRTCVLDRSKVTNSSRHSFLVNCVNSFLACFRKELQFPHRKDIPPLYFHQFWTVESLI